MSIWKSQQGSDGGSGGDQAEVVDVSKLVQEKVEATAKSLESEIVYLSGQLRTIKAYIPASTYTPFFSVVPSETAHVYGIPVELNTPTMPDVTLTSPTGPFTSPLE